MAQNKPKPFNLNNRSFDDAIDTLDKVYGNKPQETKVGSNESQFSVEKLEEKYDEISKENWKHIPFDSYIRYVDLSGAVKLGGQLIRIEDRPDGFLKLSFSSFSKATRKRTLWSVITDKVSRIFVYNKNKSNTARTQNNVNQQNNIVAQLQNNIRMPQNNSMQQQQGSTMQQQQGGILQQQQGGTQLANGANQVNGNVDPMGMQKNKIAADLNLLGGKLLSEDNDYERRIKALEFSVQELQKVVKILIIRLPEKKK